MPDSNSQFAIKSAIGHAALAWVMPNSILGVGTGSTVNHFIEALGLMKIPIAGAISSSELSTQLLLANGISVIDPNCVDELDLYIDGADEIDPNGFMIKGGGAALTREKIIAALASRFICIADNSKQVKILGNFPVPVEIIPMATSRLIREFADLGGAASLRCQVNGKPVVTDNGQHILDVHGLTVDAPLAFEDRVSQWPGVITVGVFAHQKANICISGSAEGIDIFEY